MSEDYDRRMHAFHVSQGLSKPPSGRWCAGLAAAAEGCGLGFAVARGSVMTIGGTASEEWCRVLPERQCPAPIIDMPVGNRMQIWPHGWTGGGVACCGFRAFSSCINAYDNGCG